MLGLLTPLVFMVIIGLIGLISLRDIQHTSTWVTHTQNVILKADGIIADAVNMETGMRGFLLAGKEEFLEPYDQAERHVYGAIEELQRTVADNPGQVERLSAVERVLRTWQGDVVLPQIALRRQVESAPIGTVAFGTEPVTMDHIARVVGEARGKAYFDNFRALMAAFVEEEQMLMEERAASQELAMWTAVVAIATALIVALASGTIIGRLTGRSISGPIVLVTEALRRLADGDRAVEIAGQDRLDEAGDIARAAQVFKETSERIEEMTKADAENARKLEQAAAQEREREEELARASAKRNAEAKALARKEMMATLQGSIAVVVEGANAGEFDRRVALDFEEEELNELAGSINGLMDVLGTGIDNTVTVLSRLADGDLRERMEGHYEGAFLKLQSNLNGMADRLSGLTAEIADTSQSVGRSADEISGQVSDLLQRTSQQAATIEETSAATEEMSVSVRESARSADAARGLANEASERARLGSEVVLSAIKAMSKIESSQQKVTDIISLIDEIAFQTNLLALNASVEAARAGPAGRGFSVVAQEVRGLAQRSSDASKDIRRLIEESGQVISKGVTHIRDTGQALEEIQASAQEVCGVIDQVATATGEQATASREISSAVTGFDKNIQDNARMAETTDANAQHLRSSAERLGALLAYFTFDGSDDAGNPNAGVEPRSGRLVAA